MPFQCNQKSLPIPLETSDDHLELVVEIPSRVSLHLHSCAVDARGVLSRLSIPLPQPRHVLHVLALARTQIRIYLRNKHKRRVEMKLEWCKQT